MANGFSLLKEFWPLHFRLTIKKTLKKHKAPIKVPPLAGGKIDDGQAEGPL